MTMQKIQDSRKALGLEKHAAEWRYFRELMREMVQQYVRMHSRGHGNDSNTKYWQADVLFPAIENDAKLKLIQGLYSLSLRTRKGRLLPRKGKNYQEESDSNKSSRGNKNCLHIKSE
jgi:hypothetical protein